MLPVILTTIQSYIIGLMLSKFSAYLVIYLICIFIYYLDTNYGFKTIYRVKVRTAAAETADGATHVIFVFVVVSYSSMLQTTKCLRQDSIHNLDLLDSYHGPWRNILDKDLCKN